jgi:hypothetical protein
MDTHRYHYHGLPPLPWSAATVGVLSQSHHWADPNIQLMAPARFEHAAPSLLQSEPRDQKPGAGGSLFSAWTDEVGESNSTSACSNHRVVDRLARQNRRATPPTNPVTISPKTIQTVSTKKTQTISLGTSKKITATQINAPPKTRVERSRFIIGLARHRTRYASIFTK